MAGDLRIRNMQKSDRDAVMRIFNHYATTGFAAYPDGPLPPPFFALLREGAVSSVVLESNGGIVGFGILKPFLPFSAFHKTGMLSYFIAPEMTGNGLGRLLLTRLSEEAKKVGMCMPVANMSSKNVRSIRFHKRHGFVEAGSLTGVGEKFGETFGIVWMQRVVEQIRLPALSPPSVGSITLTVVPLFQAAVMRAFSRLILSRTSVQPSRSLSCR